ncbi:MAG: alpha/beta hydrolase [Pseudomonadota bacterium]
MSSAALNRISRVARLALASLCCLTSCNGETIDPAAPSQAAPKAAILSWNDLLSRPKPAPPLTVTVGTTPQNVAELWLPDEEGPHPVVIMIHGGCWQKAIADRTLMHYAADALARAGFAVWNIEYRGVDEEGGGYPGTFLDVALAADALVEVASERDLDLKRVVAYGHSAGGHLALWLAGRENAPTTSPLRSDAPIDLAGVVNTGGLADLEASAPVTLKSCLADILPSLVGAPSSDRENVFADTSPAELLPLGVAQVSINGAQDRIAPPVLGEAYTEKARAAGDEAIFALVEGGHVELIAPGTPAFDETIAIIRGLAGER